MKIRVKICGLKTVDAIKTAQDNGAEFLGFIFYAKSPRHLSPVEAGRLGKAAISKKVAVVVDADDTLLQAIIEELNPDYLQLHGKESEARAQEIKDKFGIPLILAVEPNQKSEIKNQKLYDYFLIDSPNGGGSGKAFDWKSFKPPAGQWFLSGGLNIGNIAEAVKTTGATMVDVSSGVESSPGVKDLGKIEAFLARLSKL